MVSNRKWIQHHFAEKTELGIKVTVVDVHAVISSGRKMEVSPDNCECTTFKSIRLACRQLFVIRGYNNLELYCPNVTDQRWTRQFNTNHLLQFSNPPSKVTTLATPRKRILDLSEKYKNRYIYFDTKTK
jgi:hypothetical protein